MAVYGVLHSLVPRPNPLVGKRVWCTSSDFLGLWLYWSADIRCDGHVKHERLPSNVQHSALGACQWHGFGGYDGGRG